MFVLYIYRGREIFVKIDKFLKTKSEDNEEK